MNVERRVPDPQFPGMQPLWVIDFRRRTPDDSILINYYSPVKQLTPHAPGPILHKNTLQALDFLEKIKEICKRINEECQTSGVDLNDLKKTKNINQELGNLDELIRRLNDLLKRFIHPDKKSDTPNE